MVPRAIVAVAILLSAQVGVADPQPGSTETTILPTPGSQGRPTVTGDLAVRAKAHFETGQGLYHLGRYEDAIREFSAGYSIVPKPEFLLNLAQAFRALGKLDEAHGMLVRFLEEAPPDQPYRGEVTDLLKEVDRARQERSSPNPIERVIALPSGPAPRPIEPRPRSHRVRVAVLVSLGAALLAGTAVGLAVGLTSSSGPSPTGGAITVMVH